MVSTLSGCGKGEEQEGAIKDREAEMEGFVRSTYAYICMGSDVTWRPAHATVRLDHVGRDLDTDSLEQWIDSKQQ